MADLPSYGIDPSIVNYLQGGGAPSGGPSPVVDPTMAAAPPQEQIGTGAPSPDEAPSYGIPQNVTSAVQSGFAPQPSLGLPNPMGSMPTTPQGAQLAPPVTPQMGVDLANTLTGSPAAPPLNAVPPSAAPNLFALPNPAAATNPGIQLTAAPGVAPVAGMPSAPAAAPIAAPPPNETPKQKAARLTFEASPEGIAQKADTEQRAALDKERQANADASAAEQATNDATDKARQAHMDRQAQQDKLDAAKNAQDAANVDKYTQQYAQQIKDAAGYKVNTDRGIGTGGLLAIALSGIGDALDHQHGPNKALEIIETGIDKRIADQWAQKKSLGETADSTKGVLDVYRRNTDDDRQAQQFQKAAELSRASDEAKQAAAQYANPAAKARAETLAAGLDQKAAAITQGEAQRKVAANRDAQDMALKRSQLGVSYGNLDLENKKFMYGQQKDAIDEAEKLLLAKGADKDTAAKQAQQLAASGVMTPTGAVKNPDGTMTTTQEYAKNADGTPYQVPDKLLEKFTPKREAFYTATDAVDKLITNRSENGGDLLNSADARAKLQQVSRAVSAIQEAGGSTRVSEATIEQAMKKLDGGADPTSVIKSVIPALKQFRKDQETDFYNTMRAHGNYTGKPIHIFDPNEDAPKAAITPQQKDFEAAMKKPSRDDYTQDALNVAGVGNDDGGASPERAAAVERGRLNMLDGKLTQAQSNVLNNLGGLALAGKSDAKTQLEKLRDDAQDENMRQAAQYKLKMIEIYNGVRPK